MLNTAISKTATPAHVIGTVLVIASIMLAPAPLWAGPVNLNTADAETIARELTGIGEARAQAIVDYRSEYGAFESTDELLNVAGIGRYILDANQENILLEAAR